MQRRSRAQRAISFNHSIAREKIVRVAAHAFMCANLTPWFGRRRWVVDYILALLFGIFFQYFTIAPMRNLSLGEGLVAASKADFLSLTAWQVGMYGWMAIATFLIIGHEISKTSPVFWFMMQIAMLAGFLTSYPVNWWLLRAAIKEKM
jgi:Domain of unknown function (DUF4396)